MRIVVTAGFDGSVPALALCELCAQKVLKLNIWKTCRKTSEGAYQATVSPLTTWECNA